MSLLNATEEWLYDEGEDQTKSVYDERLTELKKHGNPVCDRQKEHAQRDSAFNSLATAIVHYEKIVIDYNEGVSCIDVMWLSCGVVVGWDIWSHS